MLVHCVLQICKGAVVQPTLSSPRCPGNDLATRLHCRPASTSRSLSVRHSGVFWSSEVSLCQHLPVCIKLALWSCDFTNLWMFGFYLWLLKVCALNLHQSGFEPTSSHYKTNISWHVVLWLTSLGLKPMTFGKALFHPQLFHWPFA